MTKIGYTVYQKCVIEIFWVVSTYFMCNIWCTYNTIITTKEIYLDTHHQPHQELWGTRWNISGDNDKHSHWSNLKIECYKNWQ